MNDPEVTMHEALPSRKSGLHAQTLALEAAGAVLRLVARAPSEVKSLAEQVRRAACSVALNLAEGHGRFGGDRRYHYGVAYGSAKEAGCALELLAAGGFVDASDAAKVAGMLDEVRAMTWRLIHPRR